MGVFAVGNFAVRNIRPKEIPPYGYFAVRKFHRIEKIRRTEILPYGNVVVCVF